MFGIKTKVYNIVALVFGCLGIVVLALKVFGVLPLESWKDTIDKTTMTLISLVLFMIGIVVYMRPKMKKIKKVQEYSNEYRNDLYMEITKGNKLPQTVHFIQNEEGKLGIGNFTFERLNFNDALYILDALMKDYVMIVYGVLDDKKRKIVSSKIEYFEYTVSDNKGKELVRKLIENNVFIK